MTRWSFSILRCRWFILCNILWFNFLIFFSSSCSTRWFFRYGVKIWRTSFDDTCVASRPYWCTGRRTVITETAVIFWGMIQLSVLVVIYTGCECWILGEKIKSLYYIKKYSNMTSFIGYIYNIIIKFPDIIYFTYVY